MKTSDFNYTLPPHLIAQTPTEPRDHSRLMVVCRRDGSIQHRRFFEIVNYLEPGDVLVFNDSRVIPARLLGHKVASGGKVEVLLLRRLEPGVWEALVRPGRRMNVGTKVEIGTDGEPVILGEVLRKTDMGTSVFSFSNEEALERLGRVPLPPYIHTPLKDPERYQTVYARVKGSVAAPTAGLHFTPRLIDLIQEKGIRLAFVTLHVGLDTFRPVPADDPRNHRLHREYGELSEEVAQVITQAKGEGKRIICVGTTTVRLLEEAAQHRSQAEPPPALSPFKGWSDLFILPGHHFHIPDALITNFHLPRSTLLMLVSAFAGKELTLAAYGEAIRLGYRFYSFGDCMLIL